MKDKQKKIIRLTGTQKDIFEEAYFILKEPKPANLPKKGDMSMAEAASRIVSDSLLGGYFEQRQACKKAVGMKWARIMCGAVGLCAFLLSAALLLSR